MTGALLDVRGLGKVFHAPRGFLGRRGADFHAVRDVSFSLAGGETLGIVGESGSGKSTTARMLLRLIEPSAGELRFGGEDLRGLDREAMRRRRRDMQMVFQDPFSSLSPRLTIGAQIAEPIHIHGIASGRAVGERVASLLATVGLDPARAASFPHEFSGGQRQRIAIARALAAEPRLIVADEAVSALDVSVRAQILNLFEDLKRMSGLALIFISHDLSVVRHLVDRIAVMYRGAVVEHGPTAALFARPRHPYTRALLEAMPVPRVGARAALARPAARSAAESSGGCAYVARCPLAIDLCRREAPPPALGLALGNGHVSACHRPHDVEPTPGLSAAAVGSAEERLARLQACFVAGGAGAGAAS